MANRDFSGSISIAASDFSKEKRFWLKKMSGDLQKSCFPYDHIKKELNKTDSRTLSNKDTPDLPRLLRYSGEKLMGDIYNKLLKLSKNSDYVLHMILIAGVVALLNKYSENDDIIIGTPIYKQEKEEEFLNTVLPLRIILKDLLSFKELLIIVRESMVEANENQNYPIETMLFQLNMSYNMGEFPLFDVAILLENLQDINYILHTYPNIIFSFFRDENGIQCLIEYNAFKYEKSTIERVCRHFSHLLNVAINDLDIPISQFEILSDKEKEQLLIDFNSTTCIYPSEKAIDELFEDQVRKNPNTIAVTFEGKPLTYFQLNKEADMLAVHLNSEVIQLEEPIALMVNDSYQIIVAILSILKAGGAYVPLNVEYPLDRKKYILNDCNIKRLITNDSSIQKFPLNLTITVLDKHGSNRNLNPNNIIRRHKSDNLAYIMYTSGSTGKPKGVMVRHRSAVRLVKNTNYIEFNNGDSILLTGALEFDASTFEIWGALLNGLPLHLTHKNTLLNHELLKETITNLQITTMWMTSPLFNQIVDTDINIFSGLKKLLLGGDVLSPVQINRFRKHYPEIIIINGYGPTENTTFSTTFRVDKEYKENIPIGKPISNSTVFILDSNYYLIPIGVRGELFVGGDGISRGYLNNPELTSERFQNNPIYFRKDLHKQKIPHIGTLYKTGDFSRWLSDGNIEFLGRKDHQVKIRGFRIEPGEIENHLRRIDSIRDAVVLDLKNTEGEKYLCAYIILDKKKSDFLDIIELKLTLSQQLPDYMIPTYLIRLENIPLKNNGKVDRKALPEPEKIDLHTTYIAPRTSIEKKFVEIWSEILRINKERIGIDTDFFELGGHSLKATILISKLHEAFDVKLPLAEIFRTPNIRELAIYIHTLKGEKFTSIFPYEKKEYYDLSSAQRRLYYLQEFKPDSTAYNIPVAYILKGEVDRRKWEEAFRELIQRHESLRTSFHVIDKKLVQIVHDTIKFEIEYYDLFLKNDDNALYRKLLVDRDKPNFNLSSIICNPQAGFIFPFDLSEAPLLKIRMIQLEEKQYLSMVDIHHIIIDGSSLGIFIKEFCDLYKGEKPNALKIQYKDYSQWQNCISQQKIFKEQENYWEEQFESEIQTLKLPLDYPRPLTQNFEGSTIDFKFTRQQFKNFNRLASEQGATLYMVLLATYYILLYKLSNQEDIIVGTPIAARSHSDLEQVIGMFVNTLPLRNFPYGQKQFSQFLKEIKRNTVKAFENQDYPFEDMVERLNPMRDTSRNPFFDTMFTLQNFETLSIEIPKLTVKRIEYKAHISKFDLTFTAFEHEGTLLFIIEYCTKLFKEETIRRFADFFINIVSTAIQTPNIKICEMEIIDEKEKNRILFEFNNTTADYPKDKTIMQLFEEQVKKSPDSTALNGWMSSRTQKEKGSITYRKLSEASDYLALVLIEKGIGIDTIIALMIDRTLEMVILILGILKTAGAYLPIDPDYPQERINYILKDSNAKIFVLDNKTSENETYSSPVLDFFSILSPSTFLNHKIKHVPVNRYSPTIINTHHTLAYIIYTSGSTGKPKGVMVEQKSVINLLYALYRRYPLHQRDTYLLKTSYLFDVSVTELFGWFMGGGRLTLLKPGEEKDPYAIMKMIIREEVTHINFVPSMFHTFIEVIGLQNILKLSNLKYIFLAGEELLESAIENFIKTNKSIIIENIYGPTEASVYSSWFSLSNWDGKSSISIGKPLPNVTLYILGFWNNLQPIGVPGELCIAGEGLARGYLNHPELTNNTFIQSPIYQDLINSSGKSLFNKPITLRYNSTLYKTGDLSRWLLNGNIEFLGRIDYQVKIRGFRVELGEIENCILSNKHVKEAVVVHKTAERDNYVCAYFVSDKESEHLKLHDYLSQRLPYYMIPSYFVKLSNLPLTPNGKVDRKSLPMPMRTVGELYIAPRDEIEKQLTKIWAEILDIEKEKISIKANFFNLGGHSLKATILVSKIHKEFDIRLTLTEFFKTPRIEPLAQYIKEKTKDRYISIQSVEKKEYYPLSSAQRRLYYLQEFKPDSTAYNIPVAYILKGDVNRKKWEDAFRKLIQRHENLRTSFHTIDKNLVQIIHDQPKFEIDYNDWDLKDTNNAEYRNLHKVKDKSNSNLPSIINNPQSGFIVPFDLSQAPLLKVQMIQLEDKQHLLMVDIHHIIIDGISMGLFINEFRTLYEDKKLNTLRIQYKDYSQWQHNISKQEYIKKQEIYWKEQFESEFQTLKLPSDYSRPLIQSFEGSTIDFKFTHQQFNNINRFASEQGVTLYMVLLAIYYVLLYKLSNQEDIIVGTPIAARRHSDLEQVIGMFVNTLALRNFPHSKKQFNQFLEEVKSNTLKAFENQDFLFEDMVELLNPMCDTSRNPFFDTMFILQNFEPLTIEIPQIQVERIEHKAHISKFDLTLTAFEHKGTLLFVIEYCTKLFKEETIRRFADFFIDIVSTVIQTPSIKICDIGIIDEKEKNRILFEFNNTASDYPKDKTIQQLFEEQVKKSPDSTALNGWTISRTQEEEGSITYKKLSETSDLLAIVLVEKAMGVDTIIGLMIDRTLEMVILILSILKASSAYLPIDPDYPQERINYILKDSKAKIVILGNKTFENETYSIPSLDFFTNLNPITIDHKIEQLPANKYSPAIFNTNRSIAYIIYTSGSTGKPKGVMVEHKSVINLLYALYFRYPLHQQDTYLLKTSYLFDVSVTELFGWFMGGGRLTLLKPGEEKDPYAIMKMIIREEVTHINFVPSMFHTFIEVIGPNNILKLSNLKYIFLAGEELLASSINKFITTNKSINVENIYGPTEASVYSSWFSLSNWDGKSTISIGKPLPNVSLYILDYWNNLQPIGIPGELCIAGEGLARGYLNHPEMTNNTFIQSPIYQDLINSSGKSLSNKPITHRYISTLYKTGDLSRWLLDGNIEFLGRIDHQVKIRGFRVELGEIENCILSNKHVKETVVVHKTDEQDNYICAYFVSDKENEHLKLHDYLSQSLPYYMIPSYFVKLDHLPLTPNGKVDRKSLPMPMRTVGESYIAPRDEVEMQLTKIWAEILDIEKEKISTNANFFNLGGHSLKVTILVSKIHKEFDIRLTLTEFFKTPKIEPLAQYIKKKNKDNYISIQSVEKKEFYNVSKAQKRLYIFQQMHVNTISYNIHNILILKEKLDVKRIENVFNSLISRHESLRTSFLESGGKPIQKINEFKEIEFKIEYFDIRSKNKKSSKIDNSTWPLHNSGQVEHIIQSFIRPFNLSQAPLIRVGVIQTSPPEFHTTSLTNTSNITDQYILIVDMHHIITDGVSHKLLTEEFLLLYTDKPVPKLKLQYKEYSEWQQIEKQKEVFKKQENYWLNHFQEKPPLLNLPTDFKRPKEITKEGKRLTFLLEKKFVKKIEPVLLETGTTLYIYLLTVYYVLLFIYTKQEDIIVGSPVAGRRHNDFHNTVGMFVNMLAIRNRPHPQKTFIIFLKEVKNNALNAFENQEYQFEELVDKINIQREPGRRPLVETVFTMQNTFNSTNTQNLIQNYGLKIESYPIQKGNIMFDLTLDAVELNNSIKMWWTYSTELFKTLSIEKFRDHYIEILKQVLENSNIKISEIKISHSLKTAELNLIQKDEGDFGF